MIQSFPPISNHSATKLILGTMPGVRSLEKGEYYAHGGNQFWKIMFVLFDEPFSNEYENKKQLLIRNNIALWDVLQYCEREGSSDNAINQEVPNDFNSFFKSHPDINKIFFNGNNARDYFLSFFPNHFNKQYHVLPSTSPANTLFTADQKIEEWRKILN